MQRFYAESERLGRSAQSGADGVALLQGLDPQRGFQLSVTPATEREDLLPWSQTAWTPADLELRLERGYTVSGFVRDATGKPVPQRAGLRAPRSEGGGLGGHRRRPGRRVPHQGPARGPGGPHGPGLAPRRVLRHRGAAGNRGPQAPRACCSAWIQAWTSWCAWPPVPPRGAAAPAPRNGNWGYLHELTREPGADRVVFHGLTRDTVHMLWSEPDADGVYGLLRDVRPGGEVSLPLERGGTLRGRIRGTPGDDRPGPHRRRPAGSAHPGPGGARRPLRGARHPPGTWDVQAQGRLGDAWLSAQGEAQPAARSTCAWSRAVSPRRPLDGRRSGAAPRSEAPAAAWRSTCRARRHCS